MEIIKKIELMQELSDKWRRDGHIISCVPTMGFLHQGHVELLRVGRDKGDRLIMTIFVNPTQFGPHEDYERYPRDTEGDLDKARSARVDAVFMPTVEEMYPDGFQSAVTVNTITQYLCGKSRPGHFAGVTIVVAKLFNITKPHLAIFGEKDYQQLAVIRQMVRDLNMDIDIIGVPTVREQDGLAMSSRNKYLSPEERLSALSLKKGLDLAKAMIKDGEKDSATIKTAVRELILAHPFTEIDYVTICDPEKLTDIEHLDGPSLLALAVKVGKARLIDNIIL
ncbi:MAG: pantoate--beta-alanine ligase [Deltaproteobacteria bacterium]|nr:pantoate--beta-alanine ligase [Deltaproteobacteria bacterium]MBW2105758.1 pantoate--beta-alanine ligase [Deltaproteobacteria bacterium]